MQRMYRKYASGGDSFSPVKSRDASGDCIYHPVYFPSTSPIKQI